MKKRIVAAAVLLALTLTACGKKENVGVADDYEQLSGSTESSDIEKIPEHVNFTAQGYNVDLTVDADVVCEGMSAAKVYDEQVIQMDDKRLCEFAETIFDSGIYEVIKPYALCTKEELEQRYEQLFEEYEGFDFSTGEDNVRYSGNCEGFYEMQYYITEGIVKVVYEDADDETVIFTREQDGARSAMLRGTIDGRPYNLYYREQNGFYTVSLAAVISTTFVKCIDEQHQGEEAGIYGENACSLDEAVIIAEDILKKAGITDYTLTNTYLRVSATVDGVDFLNRLNGYRLYYTIGYDGMYGCEGRVPVLIPLEEASGAIDDQKSAAYQSQIYVDVDSYGLVNITFGQFYEQHNLMETHPNMLSFEQIQKVTKDYIEDMTVQTNWHVKVDKIVFGYVSVLYEDKLTLIPAWMFYYYDTTYASLGSKPELWLAINAMDGSMYTQCYKNVYVLYDENTQWKW